MTKLVAPMPVPEDFIAAAPPTARWWRIDSEGRNAHGHLYVLTHDGGDAGASDASYLTVEWFDGHALLLDAGMDRPAVWCMALTCNARRVAVDLLAVDQPTPDACPMTEPGHHVHPDDHRPPFGNPSRYERDVIW